MSDELGLLEDETDYFLGPVLGRGVTGYVYEGFRRTDGLDVVIKVLSKKLIRHESVRERIKEDVACAAWADVRHKNVARTLDMVEIEGRPAVVALHAPGTPLSEILEEHGPITDRRALKLAMQLVEGLMAGLRKGLHHGDIRPHKLYVDTRGRLWITDFGMAYASAVAHRFRKYANLPFGHPEYLAPEVIQNNLDQPTESSDLYAIGITLYELVCGQVPFRGLSAKDTLRAHLEDRIPPPPPRTMVSEGMADLILMLTSKDPERRIRSLGECLRQLKGQLTGRDPNEVSMSNADWTEASGRYAIAVQGWDAAKIEPTKSHPGRESMDEEDEPPEVLFPPGEFMSGTGFFKPQQSQLAAFDVFDQKKRQSLPKRVAARVQHKIENVNLSGRDILLLISLAVNALLIALIIIYGLGRKAERRVGQVSPPAGPTVVTPPKLPEGQPAPPSPFSQPKDESASPPFEADIALQRRLNVALQSDAAATPYDPEVVLVVDGIATINLAALPAADAFTERAERERIREQRVALLAELCARLATRFEEVKELRHADIADQVELRLDHSEARARALRELFYKDAPLAGARKERVRRELELLSRTVRQSKDAYELAVGYGALGETARAVEWLNEALLRGFRDLEALQAEPLLAPARADPAFWKVVDELQIEGLRRG